MGRRQAQGVELRGIESQWAARLDAEEAIACGNVWLWPSSGQPWQQHASTV
jgi:hypothetical protein